MKMRYFVPAVSAIVALILCAACRSQVYESYTDTVEVNGVSLYYSAEGSGKPVILLHGNGGSHSSLETTSRQLAQAGYMVYALDSRGQGANRPLDEYHYKDMATDVYEFIRLKGLEKPAVLGYSDGGIIALQLEVMYPGTLGVIMTGGANIFVEGAFTPEFEQRLASKTEPTPLQKMMLTEPSMTAEDMRTIKVPALIMAGENDVIAQEHTRLIGENIPRGTVRIFEGASHSSYIRNNPDLAPVLTDYLKSVGY